MRDYLLRALVFVLIVAVLVGGTWLLRRPGPCDDAWRLPVYAANGQVAVDHIGIILDCHQAEGEGPLCPPRWSEWHDFLAPEAGCP